MPIVHEFPSIPMKRGIEGFGVDASGFPVLSRITGAR
jgi:hypothetical protein